MHALERTPEVRGGFVHVPYGPDQVSPGSGLPSIPLEQMAEALAAVVRTALATSADLKLAAGAIH
jgi:pyroglutamyl-peptidase